MIKKLSDMVIKASGLSYLIIFAAAFIAIEIFFSINLPLLTKMTEGRGLLDMSLGYSSDFAYEHLASYKNAPPAYLRIRIADFFFPIVYAFLLSILLVFVYRKKYAELDNYRWILCVPFAAAFFDYSENIMLTVLYGLLPARFDSAIVVLNVVTILKFGLLSISILLLLAGALSLLKGGDSGFIMGNKFKGKK
ncbi:MAG: hypothetical protein JEZ04_22405 [Spirochaetales bacterium]|nr:hypothetical protein [Spirochaetales bacterium]